MNFVEEQQKEARKKLTSPEKVARDALRKTTDAIVTETITNTLNHILESGLLEEKKGIQTVEHDYITCYECGSYEECDCEAHNTLARAIKEFISNMDTKSVDSIHLNKQAN